MTFGAESSINLLRLIVSPCIMGTTKKLLGMDSSWYQTLKIRRDIFLQLRHLQKIVFSNWSPMQSLFHFESQS